MPLSCRERSLTVVVPAYCEADNIVGTLENVAEALSALPIDAEILVIDDGSRDGTADVVRANLHRFPSARLLVNERNMGFGWTYRRGVAAATRACIVMVHGDNAWGAGTLQRLFGHVGDADVIVGYTRDMWKTRNWTRTAISKLFTALVNAITGRRLQYYNGLQIHQASVLKQLTIQSTGYGFQAEVLVKCLRSAKTFLEVPMDLMEREHGTSKAWRLSNAIDVARTLTLLCELEWRVAGE